MRDCSTPEVTCSSQDYGLWKYVRCLLSAPTSNWQRWWGIYPHVSANKHYCYPRLQQAAMPPAAIWQKGKRRKKNSSNVHITHTRVSSAALSIGKTQLVATKIRTSLVIVYAIAALDLEPWILSPSCRSSDATHSDYAVKITCFGAGS